MSNEAKKKVGRPSKGKRGTFTFRVTADLRAQLEAAAAAGPRSVSEEIERRLVLYAEYDKAFGSAQKIIDDAMTTTIENLKPRMTRAGFHRITTDQGAVWAEPGTPLGRMSISINAAAIIDAMLPDLVAALARALERMSGGPK